jgi:hypothetical protein
MKEEEKIAERYLNSLSLGTVEFEPDGNRPPDFKIGSFIGVEVRSLNENSVKNGKVTDIDTDYFAILRSVKNVLRSYDNQFDGKSYGITFSFKGPRKGNKNEDISKMKKN